MPLAEVPRATPITTTSSPASTMRPGTARRRSPSGIVAGMPERRYRIQSEKTAVDRLMARFAQSRLGGLLFITVFPAIDKRVMPLTGGRVRIGMRQPVLLHARGAKTGQPRVTPLLY